MILDPTSGPQKMKIFAVTTISLFCLESSRDCSRWFWGGSGVVWGCPEIVLGSFQGRFGVVLESFWAHFGVVLGSFWGRFGAFWSIFRAFWIVLGSFWSVLARPVGVLHHFWPKQKSHRRTTSNSRAQHENRARNTQITPATSRERARRRTRSRVGRSGVAQWARSRKSVFAMCAPSVYETAALPHPFLLFSERARDPL